jgi:acyl carrier protein
MLTMGLDTVELVFAVEEHFDIEIPNEVAAKLATVGMLHEFICAELQRLGREPYDSKQVLEELRQLVAEHAGVELHEVVPEASFVDDLRMD